jgi:peptidoglycan/xylan/chitin deacetylase (PgdA/CDA1 family)/alpha-ketoglutarate-dependent taurine dioxygenase
VYALHLLERKMRKGVAAKARLGHMAAHLTAGGPGEAMGPEPIRDVIGYGGSPPDPRWPGGAKVALNFVINVEEGSEPSVGDGDGATTTGLVEPSSGRTALAVRDLGAESMFEYGSRIGFWRLVSLFEARSAPVTMFACALALERNPPMAAKIRSLVERNLADICCHGWRWEEHYKLTAEEEEEHIRMAVTSLTETVGKPPAGWYCRYGPSLNTRRLLGEIGGFAYDSDSYNDELPYWTPVADQPPRLVVPYSLTNNDGKFTAGGIGTSDHFVTFCRDALDQLREEAAAPGGVGKMMSIGLHMRLMGHPARARAVARLLDYAQACPDVWLANREDIAAHWAANFPPPPPSPPPIVPRPAAASSVAPAALVCTPVPGGAGFGAVCTADIAAAMAEPGGAALAAIHAALSEHELLVFKGQVGLEPEVLAAFTHSFDRASPSVWRDLQKNPWELDKAKLGPAGDLMLPGKPAAELPEAVDITSGFSGTIAIGQGEVTDHFGLARGQLGGVRPHYNNSTAGSQVVGGGTLQWHIDGAWHKKLPPLTTCLHCVEAPEPRELEWAYDSHEPLKFRTGSTAYVSARTAYELLSKEERAWAEGVKVHYAPEPFKGTLGLPMTENGLRVVDDGRDYPNPSAAEDPGLLVLPMIWAHHATGQRAFMVHSRCMRHLELPDGTCLGVEESRLRVEALMLRAVEPRRVYAHASEPGDVVIADNWSIWHSATGGLQADDRRVMHLSSWDGSLAPTESPPGR